MTITTLAARLGVSLIIGALAALPASSQTATTLAPTVSLPDLGLQTYQGEQGGLYPGGSNQIPTAHRTAGQLAAAQVVPLDTQGQPDCDDGRIVVLNLGMSVSRQVFSAWREDHSDADATRNPGVILVNAAANGQTTSDWARGTSSTGVDLWEGARDRLAAVGASAPQVQIAYLYMAGQRTEPFPLDAQLQALELGQVVRRLHGEFPNIRIAYVSSFHTLQHKSAADDLAAFHDGFAVKWLIEDQINGAPDLNADPAQGPVVAPWLEWGPSFWSGDTTPGDHIGEAADFTDGAHLSTQGRHKSADMLRDAFAASPTATVWYPGATLCEPRAVSLAYRFGEGSPGSSEKVPSIYASMYTGGSANGQSNITLATPFLGNTGFRIHVGQVPVGRMAYLLVSLGRSTSANPIPGLQIDLASAFLVGAQVTGVKGAQIRLPVPDRASLEGLTVYGQWIIDDPQGSKVISDIPVSLSRGMEFRVAAP